MYLNIISTCNHKKLLRSFILFFFLSYVFQFRCAFYSSIYLDLCYHTNSTALLFMAWEHSYKHYHKLETSLKIFNKKINLYILV